MLRLDLTRLQREGSVRVQAEIPPTDPLWEGSVFAFEAPLAVDLKAHAAGSGEIVVRGTVEGALRWECRRCLEPVRTEVREELTLVYAPEDLLAEADSEVRPIPLRASELDLGAAIREELILALDPFVLCDEACKGLCPRCGVNLNRETCDCVGEERDPRWDVLRRALEEK